MRDENALKDELLALEELYWSAIRDRDGVTASALSDDPCVVVGAQGVGQVDRGTLAKMLEDAKYELKDFALEDVHMRRLSDDVVALAYKVKEDLVVEGEEVSSRRSIRASGSAAVVDGSVWCTRSLRRVIPSAGTEALRATLGRTAVAPSAA